MCDWYRNADSVSYQEVPSFNILSIFGEMGRGTKTLGLEATEAIIKRGNCHKANNNANFKDTMILLNSTYMKQFASYFISYYPISS